MALNCLPALRVMAWLKSGPVVNQVVQLGTRISEARLIAAAEKQQREIANCMVWKHATME